MIGAILDGLRGRRRDGGEQDRLAQLERLAEFHRKSEYRYPRKDLVGLVQSKCLGLAPYRRVYSCRYTVQGRSLVRRPLPIGYRPPLGPH